MNRRASFTFGALLASGILVFTLFVGATVGVWVDQTFPQYVPYLAHPSAGQVNLTPAQQAARLIQADYVDTNVDPTKLSQGSVQGMISSLNDPFSAYFTPDQYKKLQDSYAGRYSGIGVYLSFGTGYPLITATIPGSPAANGGILAGDQITMVGSKDTKGMTADQLTTLVGGPTGTQVTLTILRGDQSLTFTLTRAVIQVPSVRSTELNGDILYIRIYQFGSQTAGEFASALHSGLSGSKGLVLDLRSNPGGYTSAAEAVISEFVTSGETFETRGRGSAVDRHDVSPPHDAPTIPLVVLVDANSASASEIVAGSLQVHKRAELVGTVTFGKGSVQEDFVLSDGSDIHLTVERWYLPNGQTIDKKGLTPDVTVTLANPVDEFDVMQLTLGYAKDTQLNEALTVLAGG